MRFLPSLITCLLITSASAFSPPRSAESMQVKLVSERLETMDIPRLRLDGKRSIQLDALEMFEVSRVDGESLVLTQRYLPQNRFEFYAYPKSSIRGGVTQDSVSSFVQRESNNAKNRQELFEVITMPAAEGPTLIRFLGAKPITTEYVIMRKIEGEPTRVMVQDSWAEINDFVYRVRIEAPEDRFKQFKSQCKGLANSMFFLD